KAELEHLHHTCRDKRECDRIKAVLLASEGWSSVMIAQALRLHEMTVNRHISDYLNQGKLKSDNGGSDSLLSQEQTDFLINHLSQHLFHHTHEIVAYVAQLWNITFSIPGMNKWLHRQGFSYKKPCGVPHKFDVEKQQQFIEYYENLKVAAKDE
ncbi:winged helix-turn-helix domain-containing protein, partial [Enterobacter hormaechei]|nr:winged helix-turn-helix domain-containing protein [Enterobacter hormaechei]